VAPFAFGEGGSLSELQVALWQTRLSALAVLRHYKVRSLGVWTVEFSEPVEETAERLIDHALHGPLRFQA